MSFHPAAERLEPRFPGVFGYRLTTAEITYHLPDHPELLQSYLWQGFDLLPRFPVLRRFLTFWDRNLEGRLHSVRIASAAVVGSAELRHAEGLYHLQ